MDEDTVMTRGISTEIRDIDREQREFVARASTKAPVRGESLLPESWDFSRFRKNPVLPWSHQYWSDPVAGSIPVVGKSLWEKTDKEGFIFKAKFADKEFARDLFDLYAEGYMSAFSVGYRVRMRVRPDDPRFKELKAKHELGDDLEEISIDTLLYEISPVVLPADENALKLALGQRTLNTTTREMLEDTLGMRPAGEIVGDYIHWPVRDKDTFVKESFRTIDISKSKHIKAVIGKLKSDPQGSTKIQKYLFHKDHWTKEQAKKWVEEHGRTIEEIEFEVNEIEEKMEQVLTAHMEDHTKELNNLHAIADAISIKLDVLQALLIQKWSIDSYKSTSTSSVELPEISGKRMAERIGQVLAGEIRRLQGRID